MKKTLYSFILLTVISFSFGQVGIGTDTPDPSSMLDVESTTHGVLFPRMTTAQRDAITAPANGLQIYNTDSDCINIYSTTDTKWNAFCSTVETSVPTVASITPVFLGFRVTDQIMDTNNVRYNIPFDRVDYNSLTALGGSYDSTTGGFTLSPGLYQVSYGLMPLAYELTLLDNANTNSAEVFLASFENTSGNTAGSEIYGFSMGNIKGAGNGVSYNLALQNTFYFQTTTTQTFYLKGKFFQGVGGMLTTNRVTYGASSYDKVHLNNFIAINLISIDSSL